MTVGNISMNARTLVNTDTGPGYVGSTFSRVWNGADSASTDKLSENAYSATFTRWQDGIIHYSNKWESWRRISGTVENTYGGMSSKPFPFTDNDSLRLLNRLLAKVRGHSFNLAIASAEMKETYGMLHQSMVTVLSAYTSLRHGNVKKTVRIFRKGTSFRKWRIRPRTVKALYGTKSFADKWLAIRYGWIPFLSDAFEAANAIQSYLSRKESDEYSVRVGDKYISDYNQNSDLSPVMMVHWEARYQMIAKFKVDQSTLKTLTDLGLLDPTSVAWEVVPYSFVVDWFLPIGSYLEARAGIPTLEKCKIVTTKTNSFACNGISSSKSSSGYAKMIWDGGDQYKSFYMTIDRTVSSSVKPPLPSFQNPLAGTWKHFVDTYALWRNRH